MKSMDNKVLKFARRFGIKHWIKFPYAHSELSAISKLWGKYYIDKDVKIVNIRLNSFLKLQNSKPCKNCMKILSALGVSKIYYSTDKQDFVCYE